MFQDSSCVKSILYQNFWELKVYIHLQFGGMVFNCLLSNNFRGMLNIFAGRWRTLCLLPWGFSSVFLDNPLFAWCHLISEVCNLFSTKTPPQDHTLHIKVSCVSLHTKCWSLYPHSYIFVHQISRYSSWWSFASLNLLFFIMLVLGLLFCMTAF